MRGTTPPLFSYMCIFQGIANTNLTIVNFEELTRPYEALEAYKITGCSDYPNSDRIAMIAINIQAGNVNPTRINWIPVNTITDCQQEAIVVNYSSTEDEVDLFYHSPMDLSLLYMVWKGSSNEVVQGVGTSVGPSVSCAGSSGTGG